MKATMLCITILLFSTPVLGQEVKKVEEPPARTFVSIGVMHGHASAPSVHFSVTGLDLGVKKYFTQNHFKISGWEAGYQKQNLGLPSAGHLLEARVFHLTKTGKLTLKSAVGVRFGLASGSFDKTRWYSNGSYIHTSQKRNWSVPFMQRGTFGVIYPTAQFGILTKKGKFMLETGVAFEVINLGMDRWRNTSTEFKPGLSNRRILVPQLFVNIGIPTRHLF